MKRHADIASKAPTRARLCLLAALFVMIGIPGIRGDEGGSKTYTGSFTAELQPPDGCTSIVGICTHGPLTGDLEGTYDFTMTDISFAGDDADHPYKFYYQGVTTITTAKGKISAMDMGVLYFDPLGDSTFMTTARIVDGTLRYQRASGQFVAVSSLSFVTGQAAGTYSAEITHGEGDGS